MSVVSVSWFGYFTLIYLQKGQLENELDSTRADNDSLSQKLQQCKHDMLELEQSRHKYEIELTMLQQKNKTCQQEVRKTRNLSTRDK